MNPRKPLQTVFRKQMTVRPSGHGRTATWPKSDEGTVVRVSKGSIFVQWHGTCVEDQMEPDELIATGRMNSEIPSGIATLNMKDAVVNGKVFTLGLSLAKRLRNVRLTRKNGAAMNFKFETGTIKRALH